MRFLAKFCKNQNCFLIWLISFSIMFGEKIFATEFHVNLFFSPSSKLLTLNLLFSRVSVNLKMNSKPSEWHLKTVKHLKSINSDYQLFLSKFNGKLQISMILHSFIKLSFWEWRKKEQEKFLFIFFQFSLAYLHNHWIHKRRSVTFIQQRRRRRRKRRKKKVFFFFSFHEISGEICLFTNEIKK